MTGEKTLLIVRHGKSTWDYQSVSDIDRPLKDRGIGDAYAAAASILRKSYMPDAMISSPAVRALHTAIIFSRVMGFPPQEIIINQDLYLAGYDQILSVVKSTDDSRRAIMIFGHNPGFTDLVNYLSDLRIDNLPTSGTVALRFSIDKWKDISRKLLKDSYFESPHND
jgi:phosphohistidine phosphatase